MFDDQRRTEEEKGEGSIEESKVLPIPLKYFDAACLIYLYFDRANAEVKKGARPGAQVGETKSILEDTMLFERKIIPVLRDMINENGIDILIQGLLSVVHAVQYKSLFVGFFVTMFFV
jgi:hypothetical protein